MKVLPRPIVKSNRIKAVTPMPFLNQTNNTLRIVSHSPPPFERNRFQTNFNNTGDITVQLLTYGISLLSISQLRDLLRDFSLPTGGNKDVLIHRLVIYMETFCQNHQNVMKDFYLKLKYYLSLEVTDQPGSNLLNEKVYLDVSSLPVPEDDAQKLLRSSPTCLFEPLSEARMPLAPVSIDPSHFNSEIQFSLTPYSMSAVAILEIRPSRQEDNILSVTVQINDNMFHLSSGMLWTPIKDAADKQSSFMIKDVEPPVTVVTCIRYFRQRNIHEIVELVQSWGPPKRSFNNDVISSVCPLTRKLITKPARGIRCNHSACFDLTGYLCNSLKVQRWQCPICKNSLNPEDLRIDTEFFLELAKKKKENS